MSTPHSVSHPSSCPGAIAHGSDPRDPDSIELCGHTPELCPTHDCPLTDLGAHGDGCPVCAEEEDAAVEAMQSRLACDCCGAPALTLGCTATGRHFLLCRNAECRTAVVGGAS